MTQPSDKRPDTVVSLVKAQNKSPEEMKVTIALFSGGEWPEIGGAFSRRNRRIISLPQVGMTHDAFEAVAQRVLFRLEPGKDDVMIRPYGDSSVEIQLRPAFHERALPAMMDAYVAACEQRDRMQAESAKR